MPVTGSLSATEVEFGNAVPAAVHCPPPKLSNAEAAEAWSPGPGSSEEWDEEIQNYLRQRDIKEPFEEYKSSFTSFSGVLSPALRQNLEGLFANLFECAKAAGLKVCERDIKEILPKGDSLRGWVVGHWANPAKGLHDQGTLTMRMVHALFQDMEEVAFMDMLIVRLPDEIEEGEPHGQYAMRAVCKEVHCLDEYNKRLFLILHAATVLVQVKLQ